MKGATGGRVIKRVALTLVGVGVLLLSFVAYQLWGTALYEHSAQNRLRQELNGKLPTTTTAPTTAGSPVATPTTVPPNLAPRVAPTTADPKAGTPVGLLSIPRIGMTDAAVVEGTDESQLQQGPGHYQGTSLPGQAGNAAIAGHRTTYGAPFYSLNALQPGDPITVETSQGIFTYSVMSQRIVLPSNTSVLAPTPTPQLVLSTCNPRYSAAQRLVVVARLSAAYIPVTAPPTTGPNATAPTTPATLPPTLAGGDEGLAGVSTRGEVTRAIVWAALAALAAAIGAVAFRRGRRPWTWAVLATGVPLTVGALLVCFQHVSLALPQSF